MSQEGKRSCEPSDRAELRARIGSKCRDHCPVGELVGHSERVPMAGHSSRGVAETIQMAPDSTSAGSPLPTGLSTFSKREPVSCAKRVLRGVRGDFSPARHQTGPFDRPGRRHPDERGRQPLLQQHFHRRHDQACGPQRGRPGNLGTLAVHRDIDRRIDLQHVACREWLPELQRALNRAQP